VPVGHNIRSKGFNLDSAVKPREIAASTDAPGYGGKVLITNKVTTNFPPKPITPLATTLSTSSTAESRFKETLVIKLCSKIVFYRSTKHLLAVICPRQIDYKPLENKKDYNKNLPH
tara:strand:+ start:760 stop:1107 length:348 start_codon:yes stop_codon:yes gene_type:complete